MFKRNIIQTYFSHFTLNLIQSSSSTRLDDHAVNLSVLDLLLREGEGQEAQDQDHGDPHAVTICHDD